MIFVEEKDDWRAEQKRAADQEPDRSRILIQCYEVESTYYGLKAALGALAHEGKAAFWENEACTLWDSLSSILSSDEVPADGWYLVDGFKAHYYRSYDGDYDAEYDVENVRPARWSDLKYFGYPIPPWPRLLLLMGLDGEVPSSFMKDGVE